MSIQQYGISEIKSHSSEIDKHCESIRRKGFTILRKVFEEKYCQQLCEKTEFIYNIQKNELGENNLAQINELDVVRIPLYYDEVFVKLILEEKILNILRSIFKNKFILHLQNAIINRPQKTHHQTSWHRDIPYQEYVVSNPISINVFYCLSPFNKQTGATKILPYSHLFEKFPSIEFAEENSIYVEANPGDVVIFDSWLYHRASENTSDRPRYGLNHVFTVPILKQQIDLPAFLNGKYSNDSVLAELLGYTFITPNSIQAYRKSKLDKLK
jgi:ectoine hydroxylase-related dioxygenase (phytanoyl-CoA dioxygenase family)